MKTRLLHAILFSIFLLIIENKAVAQDYTVSFAYDSNGNRISRILTLNEEKEETRGEPDSIFVPTENYMTDSFKDMNVRLYPNPTSGKFWVVITDKTTDEPLVVTLYTTAGLLLETKRLTGENCEFDLRHRPAGTYFMKMEIAEESRTWKIIKK